jgi:hypothetical protein
MVKAERVKSLLAASYKYCHQHTDWQSEWGTVNGASRKSSPINQHDAWRHHLLMCPSMSSNLSSYVTHRQGAVSKAATCSSSSSSSQPTWLTDLHPGTPRRSHSRAPPQNRRSLPAVGVGGPSRGCSAALAPGRPSLASPHTPTGHRTRHREQASLGTALQTTA